MKQQPITPERHLSLATNSGQMIVQLSKNIDIWIHQKKMLSLYFPQMIELIENNILYEKEERAKAISKIDADLKFMNDILSFAIHISFLYCDLAASIRHYLSAELEYEKRYAVKQLNVIMIEGYKRIYGFSKDNIKDSFWIKSLKPICESISPEYTKKYGDFTNMIIALGECGIFDKDNRDIVVHYNSNVEKVYELLILLNADTECIKVAKFLSFLEELIRFCSEIIVLIGQEAESQKKQYSTQIEKISNILQSNPIISDEQKIQYKEMVKKIEECFTSIETLIFK